MLDRREVALLDAGIAANQRTYILAWRVMAWFQLLHEALAQSDVSPEFVIQHEVDRMIEVQSP